MDSSNLGDIALDAWGCKKLFSYGLRRWLAGAESPKDFWHQVWSPFFPHNFFGCYRIVILIGTRFPFPNNFAKDNAVQAFWDILSAAWPDQQPNPVPVPVPILAIEDGSVDGDSSPRPLESNDDGDGGILDDGYQQPLSYYDEIILDPDSLSDPDVFDSEGEDSTADPTSAVSADQPLLASLGERDSSGDNMSSPADGNQLNSQKSREELLQRMAELRQDFQNNFFETKSDSPF